MVDGLRTTGIARTTADVLRVWHFQASRAGARGPLVDARTRRAATAQDAVAGLLEHIGPALDAFGERDAVETGLRDILDSGGTLQLILPMVQALGPASVKSCVLLRKDRPSARAV